MEKRLHVVEPKLLKQIDVKRERGKKESEKKLRFLWDKDEFGLSALKRSLSHSTHHHPKIHF